VLLQLCSPGMVQLILNDGIRRKVWAALYEEKLSKKEFVEKVSSVFGKTQTYELFKEFECAYSFERLTKKQKREDAGLCPRGLPAEVLPKLLDVITEDPDRTYKTIKKVFADDHNIVLSVPQIYELINTPKSNGGLGSSQTVKHRVANEKDQCEREAFREFAHVTIPPKDTKKVITFDEMHRGKDERKTKKSLSPMSRRKEVALSSEPGALFFRMDFIESINHRQTRMLRLAFPPRACIPILDRFASYSQAPPPL
jgi:hypothetical protein